MSHAAAFLDSVTEVAGLLDRDAIERMAVELSDLRLRGGRLFVLGVGGSAANASHAVSDFRNLCGIEAYAPFDNVSELTATTNDHGWRHTFSRWLKTSQLGTIDAIFVLSVGGGDPVRDVSGNIIDAVNFAKHIGCKVLAVVGRGEGHAAQRADVLVLVKAPLQWITPLTESFQAVVWHCLVSHPKLQRSQTKW